VDPGTDTAFVTPASSFAEFMEKHVDNPKTTNTYSQTYCNYMMKERNMICKQKITFIPPTHLTSKTPAATEGHATETTTTTASRALASLNAIGSLQTATGAVATRKQTGSPRSAWPASSCP
ncbi:unnamed protein product, partial [Caretta caretta]